jgi:hypothetical protein
MTHLIASHGALPLGRHREIRPFLTVAAAGSVSEARKTGPSMPAARIDIIDWGGPRAPMIIMRDGAALKLDVPDHPAAWHFECAAYARLHAPTPPDTGPPKYPMHLGFYGYLRLCNALCLEMAGQSIFEVPDAPWRDWYAGRKPPAAAATEASLGRAKRQ